MSHDHNQHARAVLMLVYLCEVLWSWHAYAVTAGVDHRRTYSQMQAMSSASTMQAVAHHSSSNALTRDPHCHLLPAAVCHVINCRRSPCVHLCHATVHGVQDRLVPIRNAVLGAQHLLGSWMLQLPSEGHAVPFDNLPAVIE